MVMVLDDVESSVDEDSMYRNLFDEQNEDGKLLLWLGTLF